MALIQRSYASYDEYVDHQRAKMNDLRKYEFDRGVQDRLQNFRDRIRHAARRLDCDGVLCLGARFGEEVIVFRELGFPRSIGVDLEPGADESLVRRGDFHHLDFPDGAFGALYTNAIDHVFDLASFAAETRRVLCTGGVFILAATNAFDAPGLDKRAHVDGPTKFESLLWEREADLLAPFEAGFDLVERFDSTAWSESVFVLRAR